MKIGTCITKQTEFKVIRITKEVSEEVRLEFEKAREQDDNQDDWDCRPRYTRHTISKFHGIVWDEIFGYGFLANYGKENQRRRQTVELDDRIIEDANGEQFLIPADLFERYFM
ncbi:hypothetical protein [Lactiplantibacillus mudanjiangensis]|uniref:Uncharacterized protein n=1 Tax=Lactiplantibacillus mudanjiangensis TaxID=1296538 RepID=A0A660E8Y0_9LACO|nr:hypothetical protein [Lactiplantibacillus mudanjiangensis]VDG25830.1 hypothetical protein [Lactobacillus brevis ATCC 367] [Lactiplantibacillus mudanjiangensis]VDG28889.1 hypothetical protein [Lactobacillus brevis ATCC 367] [Lactiplantibacillus mudanjiangensis]